MKIHEAKINKLHAASALTSGFFFLFAKNLLQVPLPRADSSPQPGKSIRELIASCSGEKSALQS